MSPAIMDRLAEYAVQSATYTVDVYREPFLLELPLAKCFVNTRSTTKVFNLLSAEPSREVAPRIAVIGSAGLGKTTLLRFLAYHQATIHLERAKGGAKGLCPFFIKARELHSMRMHIEDGLVETIAHLMSREIQTKVKPYDLQRLLESGHILLLIDGLDEIGRFADVVITLDRLTGLSSGYPKAPIVVSSRPVYDFDEKEELFEIQLSSRKRSEESRFQIVRLSEFTLAEVRQFSHKLTQSRKIPPESANQFFKAISSDRALCDLAQNPLFLILLWGIFETYGQLSISPTTLYSDFVDYKLSTWERRKGIGTRGFMTLDSKYLLLEDIAWYMFERRQFRLQTDELKEVISATMKKLEVDDIDSSTVSEELLLNGLLLRVDSQSVSFPHLTFLEYYVARGLEREPSRVVDLISRPDAQGIIEFACGLLDDIAPILKAAIERKEIVLAAKCISRGRTSNQDLINEAIREFVREIGDPFVDLLAKSRGKGEAPSVEDIYQDLDEKWNAFSKEGLPSWKKGKLFEEFALAFFGEVFEVVSHDLNTENGEIDIILEIIKHDPFWIEFGGDALVECKNWNSAIPLKEVAGFAHKVSQARVKLAFVVSVSGFTEDAERTLRNQASNVAAPLIAPIDGESLGKVLLNREPLEAFFKDKIREMKYVRKY